MVRRRVAGEPLEYVVGWAAFCGLRMVVEPGVFVPRHRTELLVDEAERLMPSRRPVVVDLCCGSGALGAALAARRGVELYAADVDPAAVRCARVNVAAAGGQVFTGDLFDALPRGSAVTCGCCWPTCPTCPRTIALMPPEARDHETRATLDGGPDGLDLMRRVSANALQWLAPGGARAVRVQRAAGGRDVRGAPGRRPRAAGGPLRGPRRDGGDRTDSGDRVVGAGVGGVDRVGGVDGR